MPWDGSLRICGKSDEEIAKIVISRFKSDDTKVSTKFTIGGLYTTKKIVLCSKEALEALKSDGSKAICSDGLISSKLYRLEKLHITREHIVPIEALYQNFKKLYEAGKLDVKTLIDVWFPRLKMALITDEQNKMLNRAGFKKKMPEGWWESKNLDPLDRYREAGLDDSIWVEWDEEEAEE